jgi:hypothetical protein
MRAYRSRRATWELADAIGRLPGVSASLLCMPRRGAHPGPAHIRVWMTEGTILDLSLRRARAFLARNRLTSGA